jgi:hypothetical protein
MLTLSSARSSCRSGLAQTTLAPSASFPSVSSKDEEVDHASLFVHPDNLDLERWACLSSDAHLRDTMLDPNRAQPRHILEPGHNKRYDDARYDVERASPHATHLLRRLSRFPLRLPPIRLSPRALRMHLTTFFSTTEVWDVVVAAAFCWYACTLARALVGAVTVGC